MPYSLKGRNVLVTGGSRSVKPVHFCAMTRAMLYANNWKRGLGAVICKKFAEEGANIAINYFSNVDAAQKVADSLQPYSVNIFIIQGVSLSPIVLLCIMLPRLGS